jgi:glycosyltransferase involved in cell wall biosynthesis
MSNSIKNYNQSLPKVLHLRNTEGVFGAEKVIIEISKYSKNYGYDSIIGIFKDDKMTIPELAQSAQNEGLQTIIFPCNGRFDMKCARKINAYILENNINLLHCHGYKEDFYALASRTVIPKLATNHLWKSTSFILKLYRQIDIFLLRAFDCVVGVSDEIVSEMRNLGIKDPVKVQNGIDIDKFNIDQKAVELASKIGLNSNDIVFCMVSSLTPEKNHSAAIEALSNLKHTGSQLLIVGDGPLLKDLQDQVARLNLQKRVFFVGRRENIRELLSISDIFLLPSLKEGLPIALLEAMACGKAVIASRVGENANVISDGINGMIVENGDKNSLSNAMHLLLEQKNLIYQFGAKARETVANNFSSHVMTLNYCELYNRLLANVSVQ